MRSVLIAHQSSIPHYRVPFYDTLEKLKPDWWNFEVVFPNSSESQRKLFDGSLDPKSFRFNILSVNSHSWQVSGRTITYQPFWSQARNFDLIIVEDAINNITYPLCYFHKIRGNSVAFWGLGKDRKVDKHSPITYLTNEFKLYLNRHANGYFAYTKTVKEYLKLNGVSEEKIFVLNNTIDITSHRSKFNKYINQRNSIRQDLGVSGKKVLLFVSTFKKSKKADFLLESFSYLSRGNSDYHLILVGGGGEKFLRTTDKITHLGSINDLNKLAPIYIASDLFTYPGQVGLAPLQALCYDLPVITIDSHFTHGPEIEYLNSGNSIIMEESTTTVEFAHAIITLFNNPKHLEELKSNSWSSIKHLTIDNMAYNFINGVNLILER